MTRGPLFLVLMAAAVLALGRAIQIRDGLFQPWGFFWLAIALAAIVLVLFHRPSATGESRPARVLLVAILAGIVLELTRPFEGLDARYHPWRFLVVTAPPIAILAYAFLRRQFAIEQLAGRHLATTLVVGLALQFLQFIIYKRPGSEHGPIAPWGFYAAIAAAGAVLLAARVGLPGLRRSWFWMLLAIHAAIGVWVIRATPHVHMDVWVVQQQANKALLAGTNPYDITFPDIYGRPELYAPGAVKDGVVHLGFPYPPLTLLLDLPGYVLGGDFRYAYLALTLLTAVLIAHAAPARPMMPLSEISELRFQIPYLVAALFLFTPRTFFVLESGWTEPTMALLLAAVVFAAPRYPRLLPVLLGLFLVSKQHTFLAVAPIVLLYRAPLDVRRLGRDAAVAVGVGALVTLPLALWDVRAFLHSTLGSIGTVGLRHDALSYLAWLADKIQRDPPRVLEFLGWVGAAAMTVVCLRRLPRTPAAFALAIAAVYCVFFAFGKLAFCNYYYFVIAALCCAAAAASQDLAESPADAR